MRSRGCRWWARVARRRRGPGAEPFQRVTRSTSIATDAISPRSFAWPSPRSNPPALGQRPGPYALVACRHTRAPCALRRPPAAERPEPSPGGDPDANSPATRSGRSAPSIPAPPARATRAATRRHRRTRSTAQAAGAAYHAARRHGRTRPSQPRYEQQKPSRQAGRTPARVPGAADPRTSPGRGSQPMPTHRARQRRPHRASRARAPSTASRARSNDSRSGVKPNSSGVTCGPLDVPMAR